jgi:microcin C transport system substrate-binding protein
MDTPIGSGAYRIGPVQLWQGHHLRARPAVLARDCRCARVRQRPHQVKIYKDNTARLGAEGGRVRPDACFSAGDWARRVNGRVHQRRAGQGRVQAQAAHGFQSYVLNTRRLLLQDARVREALGLAVDFDWMSRQMFYGAYQRVNGIFGNTL